QLGHLRVLQGTYPEGTGFCLERANDAGNGGAAAIGLARSKWRWLRRQSLRSWRENPEGEKDGRFARHRTDRRNREERQLSDLALPLQLFEPGQRQGRNPGVPELDSWRGRTKDRGRGRLLFIAAGFAAKVTSSS